MYLLEIISLFCDFYSFCFFLQNCALDRQMVLQKPMIINHRLKREQVFSLLPLQVTSEHPRDSEVF